MRSFKPWLFILLGSVLGVPHIWAATRYHDANWITGYGALLIVFGIITIARPVVRLGYRDWLKESHKIDGGQDGEGYGPDIEEKKDAQAIQIAGPVLLIIGTIINGYGSIVWKWAAL